MNFFKLCFSAVLIPFLASSSVSFAADAPAKVDRDSYIEWLESIDAEVSPYADKLFDWFENEQGRSLPADVTRDPERLFVSVDRPLQEAIELEGAGDVEKATSYGLETYGEIDAPVSTVLETILFRWGKPVGQKVGTTYPVDPVYGYREDKIEIAFGPGGYRNTSSKRQGGVAKDVNDISSLLVREDGKGGYVLFGSFIKANGKTTTNSSMSIMMLRPLGNGKTDYRISGRHVGQSYALFGIDNGRKNFGFNKTRIREGQKDFYGQVAELKRTGKITEKRPNLLKK